MSATNRGAKRREKDFYPTPPWPVHRLLEKCQLPIGGYYLEPCVGDGAIIDAFQTFGWPQAKWFGIDVRPDTQAHLVTDFTAFGCPELDRLLREGGPLLPPSGVWDLAITNPPFSQAFEVLQEALRRARVVVLLLRLDWLESDTRASWLQENPPSVYVVPNRISFTGDGDTDSCAYAWMKWPQEPPGLTILNTTPSEIRNPPRRKKATDERTLSLF